MGEGEGEVWGEKTLKEGEEGRCWRGCCGWEMREGK